MASYGNIHCINYALRLNLEFSRRDERGLAFQSRLFTSYVYLFLDVPILENWKPSLVCFIELLMNVYKSSFVLIQREYKTYIVRISVTSNQRLLICYQPPENCLSQGLVTPPIIMSHRVCVERKNHLSIPKTNAEFKGILCCDVLIVYSSNSFIFCGAGRSLRQNTGDNEQIPAIFSLRIYTPLQAINY